MYSNSAKQLEIQRDFSLNGKKKKDVSSVRRFYIDLFRWGIVVGRLVSRKFFRSDRLRQFRFDSRVSSIANKYQRKRTIEEATIRKCLVDPLLDYSK